MLGELEGVGMAAKPKTYVWYNETARMVDGVWLAAGDSLATTNVKRYREMMRDAKRYNGKLGGFVPWMKNRVKSGMSVQAAIKHMQAEIERRGGTLAGYNAKYKPQTLTEYVKLKRVYEADQEFLARLVRIGLLEACGHKAGDLMTIMLNRSFFDQTRIKTDGT